MAVDHKRCYVAPGAKFLRRYVVVEQTIRLIQDRGALRSKYSYRALSAHLTYKRAATACRVANAERGTTA